MTLDPRNCVRVRGTGPGCKTCPLFAREFCEDFCNGLEKITKQLSSRYSLRDEEIQDVVGDVVTAVLGKLNSFREISKFSTWMGSIYRHKLADYFKEKRKYESIKKRLQAISQEPSWETSPMIEFKIEVERILSLDEECGNLFRILLDMGNKGYSQKEIAQKLNEKPNTFNQKLKRCRELIKTLVEEGNG